MESNVKEEKAKERRLRELEESGGFFGKFLAFFLGLFIGIILPAAAIAGVAYTVYNKPAKDTVNLIDNTGELYNTLFDPENGFINPDYADKLVSELLKDTASAVKALAGGGALEDLAKISPKVNLAIEALIEQTDFYGLGLEREEILAKPIGELLPYLKNSINDAPLGNLLQGNSGQELTDPLLLTICFGSPLHYEKINENDNVLYEMKQITYVYKDGNSEDDDSTKKMYDINGTLEKGEFNEDTNVFTLANGTVYYLKLDPEQGENVYVAFSDEARETPVKYPYTTIGNLTDNPSGMVDGIYLCDAMGINKDSKPILLSLAYGVEGKHYEIKDGEIQMLGDYRPRTIGELKEHSEDMINDITLADAMHITKDSHPILISLAYGTEGKHYDLDGDNFVMRDGYLPRNIGDLSNNSEGLINDIHLTDIIKPDPKSAITMYLLYGREGIHWAQDDEGNILPLEKKIAISGTKAYNEWGEFLSESVVDHDTYYVYTNDKGVEYMCIPMTPTKEIKTEDGAAILCTLNDMDGNSVGKYEPTTLGAFSDDNHLANITKRMTIGEIVGNTTAESNFLLKHVKNETIDTLPDAISNLAIADIYEEKVYDENGDGTYSEEEKTNKVPARTWWYLLHNESNCHSNHCPNGTDCPDGDACTLARTCEEMCIEPYTIEDMGTMINNMTDNIEQATLNELREHGMIDLTESTLSALIIREIQIGNMTPIEIPAPEGKETLGELTVSEILVYNGNLLNAINALQNPSS